MNDAYEMLCPDIKHKFENISLSRQTVVRKIECIDTNLNHNYYHDYNP